MDQSILCLRGITKEFYGVKALDNVSFDVAAGTVHALIGENGAGKSTLNKIISGIYTASAGEIIFDGKSRSFTRPLDAKQAGISIVHQEIKLVATLSIAENIYLGEYFHKGPFVDYRKLYACAQSLVDSLGLQLDARQEVGTLTVAQQQVVEICKALKNRAKLLIMDEPSATLTDKELALLFEIIERLRSQGITVIYVSHRLDEIFKICDTYTILRDGCHISTGNVRDVSREEIIQMMVGRALGNEFPQRTPQIGEVVLSAEHMTRGNVLKDVGLELHRGEILGISGLVGAGRTELMRAILKIDPCDAGSVRLYGTVDAYANFRRAVDCRLGLVPEDRKRQGLVLGMNVCDNIAIVRKRDCAHVFVNRKMERDTAREYVQMLDIHPDNLDMQTLHFSGGNQQKVVIAKWLHAQSDIIVIDEPTRGIDVGVKHEIYKIMNQLVDQGKSIVMISSELPELIGMCDRIYVMHEGSMKGMLHREEFSQEALLGLAMGQ